jgi:hypothetical protein
MQTIEITDSIEIRRCRYAQYRGEKTTLILNGRPVTGMARSIREVESSKHGTLDCVSRSAAGQSGLISARLSKHDGRDRPSSIVAVDRESKAMQIVKPNA